MDKDKYIYDCLCKNKKYKRQSFTPYLSPKFFKYIYHRCKHMKFSIHINIIIGTCTSIKNLLKMQK